MSPPSRIRFGQFTVSGFHLFGISGFAIGVLLAALLAAHRSLSPAVVLLQAGFSATTLCAVVLTGKLFTGQERLVFYHDTIAIVLANLVLLRLIGQPILPYADLAILGIGCTLAGGRIGCLCSACCYGRPARHGVRYRQEHVDLGFPSWLVGVVLFPLPLGEVVFAVGAVAMGVFLAVGGAVAGTVLTWCVVAHAVARHLLENGRGDVRPQWLGVFEAQWTALAVVVGVLVLEATGVLPLSPWHAIPTVALVLATAVPVGARACTRFREQRPHPDQSAL